MSTYVYASRLLDEFQIVAHWSGHYEESIEAAERLLSEFKFPVSTPEQKCIGWPE